MSNSIYIYTPYQVHFIEELFHLHQKEFEEWLIDSFEEEELNSFQEMVDSISSVFIDLKLEDIHFEDYDSISGEVLFKSTLFAKVQTTISLNNIPFFESNPFQVTYLKMLLGKLDNILIDPGGLNDLLLKDEYINYLKNFKKAEDFLFNRPSEVYIPKKNHSKIYDPIEYLITEIYNELKRLEVLGKLPLSGTGLPEKTQILLTIMQQGYFNSSELLKITALHPKDFDDHLEKLKFWLRKLHS